MTKRVGEVAETVKWEVRDSDLLKQTYLSTLDPRRQTKKGQETLSLLND